MATGKPPWSQQYQQEVTALIYIGITKSHPPIPDHLSLELQDLLLKCLHKEPEMRPSASDLLQHPFFTGKSQPTSLVATLVYGFLHGFQGMDKDSSLVSTLKLKVIFVSLVFAFSAKIANFCTNGIHPSPSPTQYNLFY